ncbi:MAG: pyridoxal phosphate-dependent aminotransferase [Paludibacteraceae bacterium]|nr:pyridoxal phosphate-dependent aminotransferase [Paludibacteraceae bacterium]
MEQVSTRLAVLSPSATLAMSQKSSELKAQGVDVISLSLGEPDFNTPDNVKEAAKKAIDDNFSFYTPVSGYMSLRNAICKKLKEENGLDYKPEQIICANGAKQAVCNAILALISKGDEVIIPTPYWVSYSEMVKLAEGTNVFVPAPASQDFKITPAQLEAAITDKTRAIILCSPSNPTGAVYSEAEIKGLADVLAKHPRVIVIADEIYEHIVYSGKNTSIAKFIKDQTVIINGVSKCYAMTGWRLGWLAAPLWIAKAVNKLQGQYTSNPSSIAQKAAEAAYLGPQDSVEAMRVQFQKRRDLIIELAKQVPGFETRVPDGAFYIFPVVDSLFGKKSSKGDVVNNADDLAMYLLNVAHVACVSGDAFGDPKCIRMSYATSEDQIKEAFKRIKAAVEDLK